MHHQTCFVCSHEKWVQHHLALIYVSETSTSCSQMSNKRCFMTHLFFLFRRQRVLFAIHVLPELLSPKNNDALDPHNFFSPLTRIKRTKVTKCVFSFFTRHRVVKVVIRCSLIRHWYRKGLPSQSIEGAKAVFSRALESFPPWQYR